MIVYDITSLEGSDIQSRQVSLAPSSVSISIPVTGFLSPLPWRHGDVIRLVREGRVLIEGPADEPKWVLRGDSRYWTITVYDYWYWMDSTPYLGSRPDQITAGAGRPQDNPDLLQSRYAFRFRSGKTEGEEDGVKMTLSDLLHSAQRAGIFPVDLDVRVTARDTVPFICSSATYASIFRQIHDWVPNAAAWFDYSAIEAEMCAGIPAAAMAAKPKFIIAEPDTLPVVNLYIGDMEATSLSIQSRPDLVPPVVAIVGTDSDDAGNFILVNSVRPQGARLSRPGAVVLTLDAGTVAEAVDPDDPEDEPEDPDNPKPPRKYKYTNEPVMKVKGATIPTEGSQAAAFWARHVPEFKDIPGLVFGAQVIATAPLTGDEGKGYSAEATKYELVEGQIGNKAAGVKWSKIILKQAIAYPGVSVPKDKEAFFPLILQSGQRWGWHSLELVTTNVKSRQYRVGGNYDSKPIDPDDPEDPEDPDNPPPGNITPQQRGRYDGIVQSYYDATRHLPFDVQGTLRRIHPDLHPGVMINITGACKEWADMRSILQGVDVDYSTRRMSLTAGPAKHLSLDKAMAATKRISSQVEDTKIETTPDPEGTRTTSWDSKFDVKKKAPESPGVGPYSKYIPPSGGSQDQRDFGVRMIVDESGAKSYQVHSGRFLGATTGREFLCGSGWEACGDSEVWANLETDKGGAPVNAWFSSTTGRHQPWRPVYKNDDMTQGIDWDRATPGFYSYKVASIEDGNIIQHVSGYITITYSAITYAW